MQCAVATLWHTSPLIGGTRMFLALKQLLNTLALHCSGVDTNCDGLNHIFQS